MDTQTHAERAPIGEQTPHWTLASRIAFRLGFVYLGLFCLTTQIVPNLFVHSQGEDIPDPATLWPLRQLVVWTGAHIFHVRATLAEGGNSGSGDDIFGWVLAFCLLIIAVLATGIWSTLDRRRDNYATLHTWFRLFLRFCLAGQMFGYGIVKVIPLQMPSPSLTTLLQPFGNLTPMGVLWSSVGASSAYEIFTGSVEVVAALLLILPRTATLGALICLAAMVEVFTLNMTYDVPVKLFAFHLILLALFLLAPHLPRLVKAVLNLPITTPLAPDRLLRSSRANRIALAAQLLFGVWLLGMSIHGARKEWYVYGGGRPNSPLYGIWEVNQMSIDQQLRSPLLTDAARWRRAIFDSPHRMAFQRMNDTFARYAVSIDRDNKTLLLTKDSDKAWKANFTFGRENQKQLTLDGDMDGHKIHMLLQLTDRNKFPLVSRGFHWIQE